MFVRSSMSKLKEAIVHEPGRELEFIIPWNMEYLLFDDILYPRKAKDQHKAIRGILENRYGVKVHLLVDKLRDILKDERRISVLKFLLGSEDLQKYQRVIGGSGKLKERETDTILKDLVRGFPSLFERKASHRIPYLLSPLPNLYFLKDIATATHRSLILSNMKECVREREPKLAEAIFRYHDLFKDKFEESIQRLPQGSFESSSLSLIDEETAIIAVGGRTDRKGFQNMKKLLFKEEFKTIFAVFFPETLTSKAREFQFFDMTFAMVDHGKALVAPFVYEKLDVLKKIASRCKRDSEQIGETYEGPLSWDFEHWERDLGEGIICKVYERGRRRFTRKGNFLDLLKDKDVIDEIIWTGLPDGVEKEPEKMSIEDVFECMRELWNAATNVLVVEPGKVIAFESNRTTVDTLKKHNLIDPHDVVEGGELVKGRGGTGSLVLATKRER